MSDEEMTMFEAEKRDARAHYTTYTLQALAREMKDMQVQKEEAENALKRINAWYDVLRYEAIPTKMDDEGIENIRIEGIGRVGLTADMFVSVKDKQGLFHWLEQEGMDDIIQPSVNAGTLKAFVKSRMKDNLPVPDEFLNINPVTRASITKAK